MTPQTVLEGLSFPECPRWHDNSLFFSDMHAGTVWRLDAQRTANKILELPAFPAGLGWLPDGTLQVVSMRDRSVWRMTANGPVLLADLSAFAPGFANDMVMDQDGRAYVGNFGFDLNGGESPKPTVLLCVEPDGKVRIAADDLWFPNGAVITPDNRTLIIAETFAARITAFDIQPNGDLANRRVFADIPGIFADGICLDAEGGVWVTCAGGNKIIRVTEGGAITHDIPLPGRHAYACMLGGPDPRDRRDLYVCTAQDHLPARTVELRSGRIEMLRVEIPGAGRP
jgi:sugar lactone lactonase YvrE